MMKGSVKIGGMWLAVCTLAAVIGAAGCSTGTGGVKPPVVQSKQDIQNQIAAVNSNPKVSPAGRAMANSFLQNKLKTAK